MLPYMEHDASSWSIEFDGLLLYIKTGVLQRKNILFTKICHINVYPFIASVTAKVE